MEKKYVLVCQGIVIMRTSDKEYAYACARQNNEEWQEYVQECRDKGEKPADNEIFCV